ncbi:MAG: DUF4388 domain-containing protein [Ktedonobacteraceae bacterium]|nr:DUF4388 domain-containing protein [Ktedonobacteraceae bacterium]
MTQQQEMITEHLVDVIRTAQLARRTGTLIVRRGQGATYEEGAIAFIEGRVSQVKVGRRASSDALNWLSTWHHCRYSFFASIPPESIFRTRFAEDELGSTPPSSYSVLDNSSARRQTDPLAFDKKESMKATLPSQQHPYRIRQVAEALYQIEQQGLSRVHRHLLLLIDGSRSVKELERILNRDENEVAALLRDLENATVIKMP